ncbi:MAG: LysR substrate-binding domain-containing protein [Oribacterium sp.]
MRDTDWTILYELSKNPNITKVAERCYKTQSAITKRLQSMEQELDTVIVERLPRGLAFTKEGRFLAQQAEKYLRLERETREGLDRLRKKSKETVTVGAAFTYAKYSLDAVLRPFMEAHPDVNFRILNRQSDVLHQLLLEGDIDVGFVRGDYLSGVNHLLLEKTQGYCVTRRPVKLPQLPDMERLGYQTSSKTIEQIAGWWRDRFHTELPENLMNAGYIDFAFRKVSESDAYLLCFLDQNFSNEYHLSTMPLCMQDGSPVQRRTWFIYPRERRKSRIIELLIGYIRRNIAIEGE